jgi:hypothetical protein
MNHSVKAVRFRDPASDVTRRITDMADEHDQLVATIAEARRRRRFMSQELVDLEHEAVALERRSLLGEDVTADRKRYALALKKAEAIRDEPWEAREKAGAEALRDLTHAIDALVVAEWDTIAAEQAQEADAIKQQIDSTMSQLVALIEERERIHSHATALLGCHGTVDANAVASSNCEGLRRDLIRIIEGGGERAPLPRRDPRVPVQAEYMAVEGDEPASATRGWAAL